MSKKYSTTTTTLLIVESPAKCKKIEELLGPGYKCVASYGHLRELSGLKDINIKSNFEPTYTIVCDAIKRKQIEFIKKEIKKADDVILGLDGDREGEKIAYCVSQIFGLDINTTKRITFNEITERALRTAINNPRTIDMNLVYAQQSRQILDMLVGFKVSPMLWKFIAKNKNNALSAGRCQTPALKIIYDNERDIKNNEEIKIYNTTGYFTSINIAFELNLQFMNEEEVHQFLDGSTEFEHVYTFSPSTKKKKKQPEPFTTSRIQQMSSNEFHFSPKETMRICQQLYEGGFITYMRTDSSKYSKEFIDGVKTYITKTYNEKYIGEHISEMVSGENNKENGKDHTNDLCQEAHEAIRPTNLSLLTLSEQQDSKMKKMYKMIWENAVESCMSSASFHNIVATITAYASAKFTHTSELIDFPGWKIVKKKYSSDNKEYHHLQAITRDTIIPYKKMCSRVAVRGAKLRYTEARLIQLLEEKGIGRPSTFSSILDKIQERGYVKKEDVKGTLVICKDFELCDEDIFEIETKREFGNEKGKLMLQPLGDVAMEFLEKYFNPLFNYEYTREMEDHLDLIASGKMVWHELCKNCNLEIDELIDGLKHVTKTEVKLDDRHTYVIGKYGPVIKCTEEVDGKETTLFKPIKKGISLSDIEENNYNAVDILKDCSAVLKKQDHVLGQHEGDDVIIKKGKFGLYITWGENRKTIKELGNRPIENVTFDEIKKYLQEDNKVVREINQTMSIRKGPKGDYLFFKTPKMKKPKFYDIKTFYADQQEDYKICDQSILKSWIKDKYDI